MARIIINCDDFCKSHQISKEIILNAQCGYITSTTLLTNFRYAERDEDIHRIQHTGIGLGLHFNITEGEPVSRNISHPLLISNGKFNGQFFRKRHFVPDRQFIRELREEAQAQLQHFIDLTGQLPTHVDSHHGAHHNLIILSIIANVFKERDIFIFRRDRNIGPMKIDIWLYKKIYRIIFWLLGIRSTNFFGSSGLFSDIEPEFWNNTHATIEVMTHISDIPGVDDCDIQFIDYRTIFKLNENNVCDYRQLK